MVQQNITKEEISNLPLLRFSGKCVVINSEQSLDQALGELAGESIIGFDTEARPSFQKGEYHPTSLIQLSTDSKCFLIRSLSTGVTDSLVDFFENKSILKIGIAIHDDLTDIKRIRKFKPCGFVDLNVEAQNIGIDSIGAKNLSGIFLKGRISKNQQTSNWENAVLSEAQITYAATDAWICLKVYQKMLPLLNR